MQPKVARAGDNAMLVDLGPLSAAELHAAAQEMRAREDVVACIPGQQSLYVISGMECGSKAAAFKAAASAAALHRVEVSFAPKHALDLAELLHHAQVTRAQFLDRLSAIRLTARYLGFRAGFAYLDGWPEEWRMPRRPTSRPVPRGSFAIAGTSAGIYPIDTPGGWNVLGCAAEVPRIAAGDEIAIVPVERTVEVPPIVELQLSIEAMEILSGGQLSTVVAGTADWSRMPPGGPFDPEAAAYVNALVGNAADAPLLECAMVGPKVRFRRRCVIAWTGATGALPESVPVIVEQGDEVVIGRLRDGLRGWLAIGSRGGAADSAAHRRRVAGGSTEIRIIPGPHEPSISEVVCEVTPQLNRVGIRMKPLQSLSPAPADLPSCGMQFGTIQQHPDGSLVAMGPDHPVTGGYLQPMTVVVEERWKLAQLAPGMRVRFYSAEP